MNKYIFLLRIVFIIAFIIHLIIRYLNPFSEKVNDKLLTVSLYFSIISLVSVLLIYIPRYYLRIQDRK